MIIEKTCTVAVRVLEKKHRDRTYRYPVAILCIHLPEQYLKYAGKKIKMKIRIELPDE